MEDMIPLCGLLRAHFVVLRMHATVCLNGSSFWRQS